MLDKKHATMEAYKRAGAEIRLMKQLGAKLFSDASRILDISERNRLERAWDIIGDLSDRAEKHMFKHHPELDENHIDVFYGCLNAEPKNVIDAEMIERAKGVARELFKQS